MNTEIKEWMEEHHIKNKELADVGKVSLKTVSHFLNGKQTINSQVIQRWAEKWPAMLAYALHLSESAVEEAMWTSKVIARKKVLETLSDIRVCR